MPVVSDVACHDAVHTGPERRFRHDSVLKIAHVRGDGPATVHPGCIDQIKQIQQRAEDLPRFLVAVGDAVGKVVDVRGGFGCQEPIKTPVCGGKKDFLSFLVKWLSALQCVYDDTGIQQYSHIRPSRSSLACSSVIACGRTPNRDFAMSTRSW